MANSLFEELAVAEVADRLQLESHFSFHDYDGDGRIVRYCAEDATVEGDLDLDATPGGGLTARVVLEPVP